MMNGMDWGGMCFGWIFELIFFIVVIWAIVTFITNTNNSRKSQNYLPHEEDALEILKKRYARGEINREQFGQMKQDLNS